MDHLLGSACRQLAELGEVERACIFLLEDGRLVPRMAAYADGRRDDGHLAAVPQRPRRHAPGRDGAAHRRADGRRQGLRPALRLVGRQLRRRLRPRRPARPQPATSPACSPSTAPGPARSPRTCGGSPPPPAPTSAASSSRPAPARPAAASLTTARVVRQLLVDGAGATGVAEAAEVLARAVQRLAGTDRSAAYLLDDDGRIAEVRHVDWPDAHKQVVQNRLVGRAAADVAALAADPRASSCRSSSRTPATATCSTRGSSPDLDLASYISVPLLAGDRLLGPDRHRRGRRGAALVARGPGGRAPGDPRGRAGRRERRRCAPSSSCGWRSWPPRRTTTR